MTGGGRRPVQEISDGYTLVQVPGNQGLLSNLGLDGLLSGLGLTPSVSYALVPNESIDEVDKILLEYQALESALKTVQDVK